MRCGPPCRLWLVWSALREIREQNIGQSVLGQLLGQEEEDKKGGDAKVQILYPKNTLGASPGFAPLRMRCCRRRRRKSKRAGSGASAIARDGAEARMMRTRT